ncbi:hypothetical protein N7517_003183 [Penicillium concentricum]|uniref:Uncharacterized protein n=1 Tax=Penicillium concentricum TaxID=293559 RepID=A0A9W9VKG8_9EURO|nr:uncharacterized protein N7517_003183 [Penicillium concentricum]KAJ5385272.1 hypothetical protein N7517_003183 [Penicillium concentricum]
MLPQQQGTNSCLPNPDKSERKNATKGFYSSNEMRNGGVEAYAVRCARPVTGASVQSEKGTEDLVARETAYGRISQQALENGRGAPLLHWKESEQQ